MSLSFSFNSCLIFEFAFEVNCAFFMRRSISATNSASYLHSSSFFCTPWSSSIFYRCSVLITPSLCLNSSLIIFSSLGSAKVSLLFITSSSYRLNRTHSSPYNRTSSSSSFYRVARILRFKDSASSLLSCSSFWRSRTLRFKFISRWDSNLMLPLRRGILDRPCRCSCWRIRSSISRSFFPISLSAIYSLVLRRVFSSLTTFAAILYLITSS